MSNVPRWLLLFTLLTILAASGASCPRRSVPSTPLQPAFVGPPTTEEVIRQINANSAPIRQLRAHGASLSIPEMTLRAELAIERPQRLRLKADTALTSTELDLGSNDDLFWMWIKRADPPSVYFCRHDQFYSSSARQVLPVEPTWLISALGIVHLDPLGQHSGPVSAGPDKLELRSLIPTPAGPLTRVLILHDTQGWVLEQRLYNTQQQLLASSLASHHRYEPATGVTLPHHVEIRLPPSGMSFTVDVDRYEINQLDSRNWQLWQMPQPQGYPLADLASPQLRLSRPPAMAHAASITTPAPYRGQRQSQALPSGSRTSHRAGRRLRRLRDLFGR